MPLFLHRSKHDRFWDACLAGNLEEVQKHAEGGEVDINWKKHAIFATSDKRMDGCTGLHMAAWIDHHQIVQYLLTRPEIEVNALDNYHRTPLWIACIKGNEASVRELLKHPQVDATLGNSYHYTPTEIASRLPDNAVLCLLMASGKPLGDLKSIAERWRHALIMQYVADPDAVIQRLREMMWW